MVSALDKIMELHKHNYLLYAVKGKLRYDILSVPLYQYNILPSPVACTVFPR